MFPSDLQHSDSVWSSRWVPMVGSRTNGTLLDSTKLHIFHWFTELDDGKICWKPQKPL